MNEFTEHMQQFLYSSFWWGGGAIYYMTLEPFQANFLVVYYGKLLQPGGGHNLLHINY